MKPNIFDRVLLLLILAGIIYLAVREPKKSESSSDSYFQYLPYRGSSGDTTASDGSKNPGGPKLRADTIILVGGAQLHKKTKPDCPCCEQMYTYAYITDTSKNPGGPHYVSLVLTTSPNAASEVDSTLK